MVFSSPIFLFLFLPLCLLAYYLSPARIKNAVLLAFSLWFYAWGEIEYALVMLVSILGNHLAAHWILRAPTSTGRTSRLTLTVTLNLLALAWFKYSGWLVREAAATLGVLGYAAPESWQRFTTHLPIGISFFTFQSISYVIDVARGTAPAQKRWSDLALYVALFPQLIAGPIVRYGDVARQLVRRRHRLPLFASGLQRFILGLSKKVLLANTFAGPADQIFAVPGASLTPAAAWLGILAYTLQIYFDFSGYSDMAIGLGRMFGFRFRENFLYPYSSRSITEFWRRWHISLSSWFRDYLYIPLGGNRGGRLGTYRNLCLVFLLCGLWHGAAWTFVVWGAYHGALLVFERSSPSWVPRGFFGHVYALLAVMIGWVIFRAPSLSATISHLGAMFGLGASSAHPLLAQPLLTPPLLTALAVAAVAVWPLPKDLARRLGWEAARRGLGTGLESIGRIACLMLLWISAAEVAGGSYNPFIYFRF